MIDPFVASALFALLTPFVLYPLLLWIRAILADNPGAPSMTFTPRVDLIICAHNEAGAIGDKLRNALALDYPRERLTIWVASDGSTDGTVQIVSEFAEHGVRCLDLPRGGKAAALNHAVGAGHAEVLAFSDANSMWTPDALRVLVQPMGDSAVGGVAGDQQYAGSQAPSDAIGERSYWSFDRQLKRWQARAGNVVSATGAIYAIRRVLFQRVPPDATDDFMVSTGVIEQGYRLGFASDAIAVEPPASTAGEFGRKVRIMTRGWRSVVYRRKLLWPGRTGFYGVELFVHKVWRRLTWIPMLLLFLLAPLYASAGWFEGVVAAGAVVGTLAGLVGLMVPALQEFKPVNVASYIVMVNAACAVATANVIRGQRVSHWSTERAAGNSAEPNS